MKFIKITIFGLLIALSNKSFATNTQPLESYNLETMTQDEIFKIQLELKQFYKNHKAIELAKKIQEIVEKNKGKLIIDYLERPKREKGIYLIGRLTEKRYSLNKLATNNVRSELLPLLSHFF